MQLPLILLAEKYFSPFSGTFPSGTSLCEGTIEESPQIEKNGTVLIVTLTECNAVPQRETVRLKIFGGTETLYPGDRIRFRASFREPSDFHNPGSFKITRHYRMKGIQALGFVSDPRWILRLPSDAPRSFAIRLEKMRERLRSAVASAGSEGARGLILSLLIGETYRFPPESTESFRKTGVAHILSISGLHITLVSLFFYFFFRLLAALPLFSKSVLFLRSAPLLCIPLIWIYIALAHWPVSAVRAGVMASFFFAGMSLWRKLDLLSALFLAAFLILSLNPLALFGASFQFSFAAVLFLILLFPKWLEKRSGLNWPKSLLWLSDSLAVSVIALLAVGPLTLYHFHNFSFAGLLANVVVVPLFNFLLMPLLLLGFILSGAFGFSIPLFWKGVGWLSDAVLKLVDGMAFYSDAGIFYGGVSLWQIVLYYGLLALFFLPREFFTKKWKLALATPLVALVLWGGKMPSDGKLKVTFVDVGQGDCAVVQLPNGKVWVIDGGGIRGSDWDVGRFIVAPYLWEEGIRRVEALFLSHPHHDHYKGLGFLAEHFGPKILFENGDASPEGEAGEWEDFLKRVEKRKMERRKVTRATPAIEEAGVRLEFLAPRPEGTVGHFDVNDNSMVMRLTYKDVAFLLPGDLMEAGELLLLEAKPDLRADVLKTGHHGSATSTHEALLNAVRPKYAVISVGAHNSYGVPDQEVLDRLEQKGIQFFRTDRQGAVTFTTDGKELSVKTFVPH